MKSQDAPSQREDIPGQSFFWDLIYLADRRLGKKEMDDLYRASLVAGHSAASEIIRSDERAREKWGIGSVSKARGLLEVWASSIIFMHLRDEKEQVAALSGVGGSFGLLFDSDGPKISKELSNFAAALDNRQDEAVNLRWQTLLCLRTFRALQDEGVPPLLDLGSLDPVSHKMVEAVPALDFTLVTNIKRLMLLGDTLMADSAGAGAAYKALRKARRSAWRRFTDWLR